MKCQDFQTFQAIYHPIENTEKGRAFLSIVLPVLLHHQNVDNSEVFGVGSLAGNLSTRLTERSEHKGLKKMTFNVWWLASRLEATQSSCYCRLLLPRPLP